ncbi:MAG: tetratricopeptide (TPR) repeat protein [Candidatus Azotimanducaceae bacterium]
MTLRLLHTLVNVCLISACAQKEQQADVGLHLDSGRDYYEQGQFNAAIIEASTALQIEPDSEDANLLKAQVYLALGASREAINLLEGMSAESETYYRLLFDAYLDRGKHGTALMLMRQQPDHFPRNDPDALLLEAKARAGLRDLNASFDAIENALMLNPNHLGSLIQEARSIAMRGDFELSEIKIKQLLETNPGNIELMTLLAAIYVRLGQLDDAEGLLSEIIFSLPATDLYTKRRVNIIRNMVRLLAYQGRTGEALIYQKMLSEAFPNSESLGQQLTEALAKVESRDYGAAMALLQNLERSAPGNEAAGTLRGVIAYLQGEHELAEEQFIKYVDKETASGRQLQMLAANQFALNRPHQVVQILKPRAEKTDDASTLALYGIAAISADSRPEGMLALKKAINLTPDNFRLAIIHARFLASDQPAQALKDLKDLDLRFPGNAEIWQALTQEYARQEKTEESLKFTENLTKTHPNQFVARILYGTALGNAKQYSEAVSAYKKALELNDSSTIARFGLAGMALIKEQWGEARSFYLEIIELDPESAAAYDRLLATYIAQDRVEDGIDLLSGYATRFATSTPLAIISNYLAAQDDTEQLDQFMNAGNRLRENRHWRTTNATIYMTRARQALLDGKFGRARASVFSALTSYPANRFLLSLLTEIEIAAGSFDEARKVIDQIGQFHPGSQTLFSRLGDLAIAENNLAEAVEQFGTAWDIHTSDSIGQKRYESLVRLNRMDQAAEFLVEWSVKIPDSVVAKINRATAMANRGNSIGALKAYEELLEKHPDSLSVMNNLAWRYLENGQIEKGLILSERAYRRNNRVSDIADTYGWALFKAGELKQSRAILQRALKLDENPDTLAHLEEVEAALSNRP